MNAESAARRSTIARLGRYRLLERIGGGATSIVYAAHDDAMDRRVAVKMIVADLEDERETRERFYREAQGHLAAPPPQHRHGARHRRGRRAVRSS